MERIAQRPKSTPSSGTLSVADWVRAPRRQGADIISFVNRPAVPEPVIKAAKKALDEAWTSGYTDTAGLPELRQAIAGQLATECHVTVDPDSQVVVTVGGKEGIFAALFATVDPGEEVIIPDPSWVSYDPCVSFAGGVPVYVPSPRENGFHLDPNAVEDAVTDKTKMIIITTPHNPTGVIMNRETLEAIADIAQRHDLLVISDECYRHYLYDNHHHVSIASLPGMAERTLTVQTTSKIFNMFGWRVGWITGPADIVGGMLKIHQHTVACATAVAQAGALAAVQLKSQYIKSTVNQYKAARDVLLAELKTIPRMTAHIPEGAYFLFPDIRELGMKSVEAARFFLDEAHVMTVPGSSFGPTGEGHVRLLFTCTEDEARQAATRIRDAVNRL